MAKRRPNNEGTIYKRKDGRWVAALSVRTTNGTKRKTRYAKSREDARIKLLKLRQDNLRPLPTDASITVAEYLTSWLRNAVEPNFAPGTAHSYRHAVEKHVTPHLGTRQLDKLSSGDVQEWIAMLLEGGVGTRTVQNAFAVLRTALAHAAGVLKIITENPCAAVRRPKHERKEILPFTAAEAKDIIKATDGKRLGGVVVLAITLGMRLAEILGLRWVDVDLPARKVRIAQQANEISGKVTLRKLKTKTARRTLDLPPAAICALQARKAIAMKEGQLDNDLVFPAKDGKPMCRSNFSARHWAPLLKRIHLKHRGIHHCRHTAATVALSNGVDVLDVSRMLGHSKASTTLDVYGHWVTRPTSAAADAIGRLYGS